MPHNSDDLSVARLVVVSLVLFAMLAAAAWSDVQTRRVANRLNGGLLIAGVMASVALHGAGAGITGALSGLGVAFVIWMPMYALRLMGGGDVKLMLASGAWLGWQGALVASLATGVAGGVLGALWLLRSRGAFATLQALVTTVRHPWSLRSQPYDAKDRVPYAVAIAVGVCTAWVMMWYPILRSVG
ncbi:MAG: prepilin peptidase [Gemmatimonadaceae bacterium]|nr:prepilin peptidase [Gemmatimonadaceae bacterium]